MKIDRLEQAIQHAVTAIAAPDDARLAEILAKVELAAVMRPQPRRSSWPWLLLVAAGAAAAGGGYWYAQRHDTPSAPANRAAERSVPETVQPQPDLPPVSPSSSREGENGVGRNPTLIYRR